MPTTAREKRRSTAAGRVARAVAHDQDGHEQRWPAGPRRRARPAVPGSGLETTPPAAGPRRRGPRRPAGGEAPPAAPVPPRPWRDTSTHMSEAPAGRLYVVATPLGNLEDMTLRGHPRPARGVAHRLRGHAPHGGPAPRARHHHARHLVFRAQRALEGREDPRGPARGPRRGPRLRRGHPGGLRPGLPPGAGRPRGGASRSSPCPGPARPSRPSRCRGCPPTASCSSVSSPRSGRATEGPRRARRRPRDAGLLRVAGPRGGRTLTDMAEVLGDREAFLCREATKVHEEYMRGTLSAVRAPAGRASPW